MAREFNQGSALHNYPHRDGKRQTAVMSADSVLQQSSSSSTVPGDNAFSVGGELWRA